MGELDAEAGSPARAGETLGERIRRLRNRRGLSLAQVAGDDFSRAFLHQVEKGLSQPSTRVLRVIAARLAAPLEYLVAGGAALESELALEQARLALARGQPRRAPQLVRPLAGQPADGAALEARALAARALAGLARPAEAAAVLAELGPESAAEHVRRADEAMRLGDLQAALHHYRQARIRYEARRPTASARRARRRPGAAR